MREILTYGSVRGVPGNRHPYRDYVVNRTSSRLRSLPTTVVPNTYDASAGRQS
jgi:hypothetical protein